MAELLVRKVDKINSNDFYLNTKCFKAGDVIAVQPDGWLWGKDELNSPNHVIVKLPKVSVSEASFLLTPEIDVDPKNPSKTLQRRAFKFDLNSPNLVGPSAVTADVTKVTAAATQKTPIADPRVFGESPNIF